MTDKVRVRFAPSPTGYLHIGGMRTAIFNHLFARRHSGEFILRIEDTDRERSTEAAVEQILDSLRWLDISWDEEPVFQSKRSDIYNRHLQKLITEGKAYRCYCKPADLEAKRQAAIKNKVTYKYDQTCRKLDPDEDPAGRPYTIRVRSPEAVQDSFDDLIMGKVPIDPSKVDDWILARTDGTPTYNFCVVDDASMGITHVIRGNDHVDNTSKQMLLYQAFGYPVPKFAHMPLTHGPDGSKLSKRREEEYRKLGISVSVQEYRKMGYLPHALLNYLARLGWSHGDQEIFSRQELEEKFDLDHVGVSAGVMNPKKLKWLNGHYLKETPDQELAEMLVPFLAQVDIQTQADERLAAIAGTLKERSETLSDMAQAAIFYFQAPTSYDEKSVRKWFKPGVEDLLKDLRSGLEAVDLKDEQASEACLREIADAKFDGKLGKVAQPLRLALTGRTASPSMFTVMAILGGPETLGRIDRALKVVENPGD